MKRLIYAPKAYIFVRSSNLNGRIYDASSDVVSFRVEQNLGDVSKAHFELRNRYRKWIRDSDTGLQIFLPMDMVTIWLQRIAGRPIQVFTGYLDAVPYYQAYPGNAIFDATCTLKKLAFSWFDPGLPIFMQWMQSTGGWTYDPTTGEAKNPLYLNTFEAQDGGSLSASGAQGKINDGGFAELLGRFMVEIAGWDPRDVLISEMPSDIPKVAARLYANIETDTEKDLANLATFLGQIMGVQGFSGVSSNTPTTVDGTPAQMAAIQQVISTINSVCGNSNIPPLVCIFAAYVLTAFDAKYSVGPNENNANWGYGLYALRPAGQQNLTNTPFGNTASIDPTTTAFINAQMNISTATQAFCALLNKSASQYLQGAKANDVTSIKNWIETALGRSLPTTVSLSDALAKAKQYGAMSLVVTTPTATPGQTVEPANFTFANPTLQALLTTQEKQIINQYYKSSKPWLAWLLYVAKQTSQSLTITHTSWDTSPTMISITGPSQALVSLYNSLIGETDIDQVAMVASGRQYRLQNGTVSTLGSFLDGTNADNLMVIQQSQQPSNTATTATGVAAATFTAGSGTVSAAQGQQGLTFQQLASFSANSAFAANFSFPANIIESINLTGNRALMNDMSCLDAFKQFCAASLREFRSLPDGRVLAFYPDYFGAHRQPYWSIQNIEITNFGIQLNDDALATHVYVVGDTFGLDGTIDWLDEATTRGVATITQAFMLNSFIQPYTPPDNPTDPYVPPAIGRLKDAYSFLKHYGARPHKEEQVIIRNTFYEFLLAWQRFMQLWSSQFATEVAFTFQPEVMAGGLIAFPDHGIQMFCQSVTHSGDYTSGFQTQAVMSAPALLQNPTDPTFMPGFALAGAVNTVGAGA